MRHCSTTTIAFYTEWSYAFVCTGGKYFLVAYFAHIAMNFVTAIVTLNVCKVIIPLFKFFSFHVILL